MNRILFCTICFFLFHAAGSQGLKPQNIYRVTVTSRYVIENGERTSTFYAVSQEIFDSLGRLHTEIEYDWETRQPDNYRWHYYDSMMLVRTDFFVKGDIDRRVVYKYDPSGLITGEQHFVFSGGDSLLMQETVITHDGAGRPLQVEARNAPGRRLYRAKSSFDGNGTEIRRRVSGSRGDPVDNIRRLDRMPVYDSVGRMVSETVRLRLSDGSRTGYAREYKYDDHGNIVEERELDNSGNQVARTEYVWQANRGRITRIIHYDADDRLEKYLAKRYEIYRTADRRQRVIDY